MKDTLKQAFHSGSFVTAGEYQTINAYKWLCEPDQKVTWAPLAQNRGNMPKHSFIYRLIFKDKLPLKAKVVEFIPGMSAGCDIGRSADETKEHLSFDGQHATLVRETVWSWFKGGWKPSSFMNWQRTPLTAKWPKELKTLAIRITAGYLHQIWTDRNNLIFRT